MALKRKGIPKAGPKKRRAKAEEEMIQQAVEEHGRRTTKARRKSSKVKTYQYKEAEKTSRSGRHKLPEHPVRQPKEPTPFELFRDGLGFDQRPFALIYWYMQCEHEREEVVSEMSSFMDGVEPRMLRCQDCGCLRHAKSTRLSTKSDEWVSYCPEGYDMFEWADLYTNDRSLWRFIHDECLAEMTNGGGDAA